MTPAGRSAAVTGATGYLGALLCDALEASGWTVVSLSRRPVEGPTRQFVRYDLNEPLGEEVAARLRDVQVLIHAAYDMSVTTERDIWRVNVDGTRRLLEAAIEAGVPRVIVLSSMSARPGTRQLYGRAKLKIESLTERAGGCAVRPGLVYGPRAGGMAGALARLARMPVTPVPYGDVRVFCVRDHDFAAAIILLASAEAVASGVLPIAQRSSVSLRELLTTLAALDGRRCRFVPFPWRLAYLGLRVAEILRVRLPFRADSLLGLVGSPRTDVDDDWWSTATHRRPRAGTGGSGRAAERG